MYSVAVFDYFKHKLLSKPLVVNKFVFHLVAVLVHLILVKAIYLLFSFNFLSLVSVKATSGKVRSLEDELRKNSEELLKRTNSGTPFSIVRFFNCDSIYY